MRVVKTVGESQKEIIIVVVVIHPKCDEVVEYLAGIASRDDVGRLSWQLDPM